MIKINPLDAHDRYQHFTKQSFLISECVQDIVNQRPFGNRSFYIFAHARTFGIDERIAMFNADLYRGIADPDYVRKYKTLEDVPEQKIVWQPRLTKPLAQTNSMLFKAYPGTDNIKIIWMIPKEELWGQYDKGKVTENSETYISIQNFIHNRNELNAPEDDDPTDEQGDKIYKEISQSAKHTKMMDKLWTPNQ
jgi:Fe-S cluster biosynthesis and repair protein YggX